MAKKKYPHRDIKDILGDYTDFEETQKKNGSVASIKIDLIDPNPAQPRKYFHKENLEELVFSIKKHQVLQPITVRKNGDRFQVIAGERRLRAAKLAGLSKITAIVKNLSDEEVLEFSLIENLQREDLTPLEEAEIFQQMINQFNYTQKELGERIGKSQQFINDRLRLLSLPPSVKKKITARAVNLAQIRKLVGLTPELQEAVLNFIIKNNPTSRETEAFIKKLTQPSKKRKRKTKFEAIIDHLERVESKAKTVNPDKIEYQQRHQLKQKIDTLITLLSSIKENL